MIDNVPEITIERPLGSKCNLCLQSVDVKAVVFTRRTDEKHSSGTSLSLCATCRAEGARVLAGSVALTPDTAGTVTSRRIHGERVRLDEQIKIARTLLDALEQTVVACGIPLSQNAAACAEAAIRIVGSAARHDAHLLAGDK